MNRMHKWLLPLAMFCIGTAHAQYYYNDVVSNRNARENYLLLKKAGVKNVTVNSFDPDGTATEGFSVKEEINGRSNTVEITSQSAYSSPSVLTSIYNADGWPLSATDSSDGSVSRIQYTYGNDAGHMLANVSTATGFPGEQSNLYKEQRNYTIAGTVLKSMTRIKNGKDTLQVIFIAEEHGWVGEERWMQKGKVMEDYYYYYNAAGKLTDIAQFNKTARRILPVYTFEYDNQGKMTSMVTVLTGTNQYRTWRYTYDARGLKTDEVVFNKYRQQEGKLTYTYQ